MRTSEIFTGLFGSLVILLASGAFAAQRGELHVSSSLEIQHELLPAGEYTVRWEDTGVNVELKIMKGKKILETVPASVETLNDVSAGDTVVITVNHDGSRSLSQILFAGQRLVFTLKQGPNNTNVGRVN